MGVFVKCLQLGSLMQGLDRASAHRHFTNTSVVVFLLINLCLISGRLHVYKSWGGGLGTGQAFTLSHLCHTESSYTVYLIQKN